MFHHHLEIPVKKCIIFISHDSNIIEESTDHNTAVRYHENPLV